MKDIDWAYWRRQRMVTVTEALLLSLGFNPQRTDIDFRDIGEHREFRKRMDKLLRYLGNQEFFTKVSDVGKDPADCSIELREFVAWWIFTNNLEQGGIPEEMVGIGTPLVYERLEKQRRREGRYSLEEAAELLAKHGGENCEHAQTKLLAAAKSGALDVFEPGRSAKYYYAHGTASRVLPFEVEAYWDDLNAWLNQYEPRIDWRFEEPKGTEKVPEPRDVPASEHIRRGIETKEVHAVDWPLIAGPKNFTQVSLRRALSDAPKWLLPARVSTGIPLKLSARWNPALIASCLVLQGHANATRLTPFILKAFPEWADEWERRQELL